MKKLYGILDDDGVILTICRSLAEVGGRDYAELTENFTWEKSDYTDPETGINYITVEHLAAAFDALCDHTGMKRNALAKVCGKHITSFCNYTSGKSPVPRLVW